MPENDPLLAYRNRIRDYPKHRESLVRMINEEKSIVVAEVGVYRCMTAKILLENCPSIKTYYMVDQWHPFGNGDKEAGCPVGEEWEEDYRKAVDLCMKYSGVATIIREDSAYAAQYFDDHSLDFVFVDADHSYQGVLRDLLAWKNKVRSGGILAGHDYYIAWPGVMQAVDELFCPEELTFATDTIWSVRIK